MACTILLSLFGCLANQQSNEIKESVRLDIESKHLIADKKEPIVLRYGMIGELNATLHLRGSLSRHFPKKSYSLTTRQKKFSFLHMKPSKKWVLYASYADHTFLRNKLAYSLFRSMGHWSPAAEFCTLYINHQYQGLYELTEKPDIGPNKLSNMLCLLKIDKRNGAKNIFWSSSYTDSLFYEVDEPNEHHLSKVDVDLIKRQVAQFEWIITNDLQQLDRICDLNALVDYFILQELVKSPDAYRSSVFFTIGHDQKIYFGPVWDCDFAFGNYNRFKAFEYQGWMFNENNDNPAVMNRKPCWWKKMYANKVFQTRIQERWNILRESILQYSVIEHWIDSNAAIILHDVEINNRKWPVCTNATRWNYFNGNSFNAELSYLKYWLKNRITWMDEAINQNAL